MCVERERGRTQEDHLGVELEMLVGLGVDHAHAGRARCAVVVDHFVHDRIRPQRHVARRFGGGQRARVATEVRTVRTAANAEVAVLARAPLRTVRERRGEVRDAADRHLALELLGHRLLQMSLDAVEIHRRQELAVRQLRQVLGTAAHADEAFDVVVPRRDLGVAHRPVDRDAILRVRFEVHRAPAIALPAPHDGAAADVIAADPVEALDLGVRMLGVVDEPVLRRLRDRVAAARGDCLSLQVFVGGAAAVGKFPEVLGRSRIVAVLHVASAIEHQRLESLLRQLLGGPAARDARADDDGIVGMVFGCTPSADEQFAIVSPVPPRRLYDIGGSDARRRKQTSPSAGSSSSRA